jgi:hypothetical protein
MVQGVSPKGRHCTDALMAEPLEAPRLRFGFFRLGRSHEGSKQVRMLVISLWVLFKSAELELANLQKLQRERSLIRSAREMPLDRWLRNDIGSRVRLILPCA